MSELLVLAFKIGFVALLWLFVLITANVIRTDLFGRKVSPVELAAAKVASTDSSPTANLSKRARKKLPTTLVVTHGAQAGTKLSLGEPILIGRSPECQLLLDDDYVSTRHARIVLGKGTWMVEDLGSTNGTFVNNERISTATPLRPEDSLRIGRTVMGVVL